jgi:hypothetical protein
MHGLSVPPAPHSTFTNELQMSQKEYAEDTVFCSLKRATQFSARRRTTQLFFANTTDPVKPFYTWIDNTPEVWESLLDMREYEGFASILSMLSLETQVDITPSAITRHYNKTLNINLHYRITLSTRLASRSPAMRRSHNGSRRE